MGKVNHTIDQGVLDIILDAPSSLNALDDEIIHEIKKLLFLALQDDTILCILMRSSSKKFFCAGGNIKNIYHAQQEDRRKDLEGFFESEYELMRLLHTFPKPILPFGNGLTLGGGLGLVANNKNRICCENSAWGMPETAIGFYPDVMGSYFLSRLPGSIGMFLGLTGYRLNAAELMTTGLATHFIPYDHIDLVKEALQQTSASGDPYAVDLLLNDIGGGEIPDMPTPIRGNKELIEEIFSQSSLLDVFESLLSSKSVFARNILEKLEDFSPLSLHVTFYLLKSARKKSYKDLIKVDKLLTNLFTEGKEFYEGIRAKVIDKDQNPNWQDADIWSVDSGHLRPFFDAIDS